MAANIREIARKYTPEAVAALLEALKDPAQKVNAAKALLAYGYGNPVQTQNVRMIRSVADLTDEELLALAGSKPEEKGHATH